MKMRCVPVPVPIPVSSTYPAVAPPVRRQANKRHARERRESYGTLLRNEPGGFPLHFSHVVRGGGGRAPLSSFGALRTFVAHSSLTRPTTLDH